jgi:hypothetical protein
MKHDLATQLSESLLNLDQERSAIVLAHTVKMVAIWKTKLFIGSSMQTELQNCSEELPLTESLEAESSKGIHAVGASLFRTLSFVKGGTKSLK